jgi:putative ABC transport system substrate-binding protein
MASGFLYKRRQFITLLGGAAAAWPLAARAQQVKPTIGILASGSRSTQGNLIATFVQRLHELGWIEGRSVAIEYRWAEGRSERATELAAELVKLKAAVIVTSGTPTVLAVRQVTSEIPIVFASAGDPVGTGLVASLARPGGNITGLANQTQDITGKRIELMKELVPGLRRLAILANSGNISAALEMRDAQAAARALGWQVITPEVRRAEDLAPAIETLKGRSDALYVVVDLLTLTNRSRISSLALAARLPTVHGNRDDVEGGGLLSYAANFPEQYRRTADFVDKILRGTKPADIPVEQPTKFDLVINLKTAKALALTIPDKLLAIADEVIE